MSQLEKCDRRSLRSQRALRQALASELAESGDLSRINVASLTERAGLTRRTFYSHYRDIPDFINQIEDGLLAEIRERIELITAAQLPISTTTSMSSSRRPVRLSCCVILRPTAT